MIKSKRGRKPKIKPVVDESGNIIYNNTDINTHIDIDTNTDISKNLPKKRGRKPKGGKIIESNQIKNKMICIMPNIILHLHCVMNDVKNTFDVNINYTPEIIDVIETYNICNDDYFKAEYTVLNSEVENDLANGNNINAFETSALCNTISKTSNNSINNINNNINSAINNNINSTINSNTNNTNNSDINNLNNSDINNLNKYEDYNGKTNYKNISKKLKELSHKLHNNVCENKSACFWCTCKFNTANIYIPKSIETDNIDVYGCFCSPECATSYLMNEHIDSSIKFERYSLLNYIYGSIYNYFLYILIHAL